MDQAGSRAPHVVSAPYGQACTNCARAKYRCIYRSDRRQCERCHRLEKECVPSVSARRLTGKHLIGPRAADLEEKIEHLMALLQNQAAEKAHAPPASVASPPPAGISTPAPSGDFGHSQAGIDSSFGTGTGTGTGTDPSSTELASPGHSDLLALGQSPYHQRSQVDILTSAFELQRHQAEDCLAYFHSRMLSLFPFVYLRPDMTAKQLREWYPFLWVNIMAVTIKHVTGQDAPMTDSIKRFVAQKMVIENEANLDLLLGLLVFICWFHFHHKGRSYITVMASLAYSIIIEMKLNKGSLETQATGPCSEMPCSEMPHQNAKSTIERRAMLAYFLLVSQISHTNKNIDVPEWTPYLDRCLQSLSQDPEWPGDEQLATQIKIQLLVEQIRRGPWKNQEFQPSVSYIAGLQSQLEKIKAQLPRGLTQNANITNQLLYAELAIQDAILSKPPVSLYSPNYQREQLLERHLTTVTRIFDHFFAIPQEQYPGMTFTRWCKMAHALVLLHRLYVLDDPSWDRAAVREHSDLFALGDNLANILAETGGSRKGAPSAPDDNMFVRFSRMIRSMCSAWWAELQFSERRRQSGDCHRQSSQSLWPPVPNINPDPGIRGSGGLAHGGMLPASAFEMVPDDVLFNEIFNLS